MRFLPKSPPQDNIMVQHADTYLLLERLGYQLDKEVDYLYQQFKAEGLTGIQITQAIEQRMILFLF